MRNRASPGTLAGLALISSMAMATAEDGPLSAIPWLSESLSAPTVPPSAESAEPPAAPVDAPAAIMITPLADPERDGTGIIDPESAGLRPDLWAASAAGDLDRLIRSMPAQPIPAVATLFRTLLLLDAHPPANSDGTFLLARIDGLLSEGALDAAQALLERAVPDTEPLFRRWFDITLLTGTEDRACSALDANPDLSPSFEARIFCLARNGRWTTAALMLETATVLDGLSQESRDRMARFLDPELFEEGEVLPLPDPVTPLDFRMLEAVGEPLSTRMLPVAFAHADLRHIIGWKARIEAAERLGRSGSLSPETLLGIYTSRKPSASGGVWDRVAAIQQLDAALNARNIAQIDAALVPARQVMQRAALDSVFATIVTPRLVRLPLPPEAALVAYELALVSGGSEAFLPPPERLDLPPKIAFAAAVATGQLKTAQPETVAQSAVQSAFTQVTLTEEDARLLGDNRAGEAMLGALTKLAPGSEADSDDVTQALRLLRALGFEQVARQAALEYLLLDMRG